MVIQRLLALALALLGATRPAAAEPGDPGATATLRVYADDDHVTVVSPAARVTTPAGPAGVRLDVDAQVDAVTAASVDVVTAASPATVREQRVELGVAATAGARSRTTGTLGARGSSERDYTALRATAGVRAEVARRNTTLELRYQAGRDEARATGQPGFRRTRASHQLTALAAQLLGPRTVLDVIVELAWARGYHASPYRQVALEGAPGPLPVLVAEATPAERGSVAVAARLRHALARTWVASGGYRAYADGWAMTSHTATVEVIHQASARWRLGALARGYVQGAARFHAARYALDAAGMAPALRTRDRTLGPMRTAFASVTVDRALGEAAPGQAGWHVVAAAGVLGLWFPAFPAQPSRRAVISTVGVSASW